MATETVKYFYLRFSCIFFTQGPWLIDIRLQSRPNTNISLITYHSAYNSAYVDCSGNDEREWKLNCFVSSYWTALISLSFVKTNMLFSYIMCVYWYFVEKHSRPVVIVCACVGLLACFCVCVKDRKRIRVFTWAWVSQGAR